MVTTAYTALTMTTERDDTATLVFSLIKPVSEDSVWIQSTSDFRLPHYEGISLDNPQLCSQPTLRAPLSSRPRVSIPHLEHPAKGFVSCIEWQRS